MKALLEKVRDKEGLCRALDNLRRIEREIRPFVKKRTYHDLSTAGLWVDTDNLPLMDISRK